MLTAAGAHAIGHYGRCPIAVTAAGPQVRLGIEETASGYRSGCISSRLMIAASGETHRHLTVVGDQPSLQRTGHSLREIFSKVLWWVTRTHLSDARPTPIHLTTNSFSLDFLGAATPLVVSLYVLAWQLARLELPHMPEIHTLELRSCTCLTTVVLQSGWPLGPAGRNAPSLRVLDIGETQIRSLRAVTEAFPHLEMLSADGCGAIEDWNEGAALLPGLRELNATATEIVDVSWLPLVPHLETLKLHNCRAIVDWTPVGELHCLRELSANYASLRTIDWIAGCSELEALYLYGCTDIEDGTAIGQLGFLRKLNIGLHGFNSLAWLRSCTELTHLWMQGSADAQVEGTESIGALTNLQVLNMAYSAVRSIGWLPSCTALQELYLVGCSHVADWGPLGELLCAAPSLSVVDLRESNLGGVAEWGRIPPNLQVLRLEGTNLTTRDRLQLSTIPSTVRIVL